MKIEEDLLVIASPRKRIIAIIIDLLINLAIDSVLLVPSIVAFLSVLSYRNNQNIIALFVSNLVSGALIISFAIFYFVSLPVIWEGQTIGKRALKIRIVDANTNNGPNARIMFLRETTRIIIFVLTFGMSAFASLITLCVSEKHTTFHDQISHTRVINVNIYPEVINQNGII